MTPIKTGSALLLAAWLTTANAGDSPATLTLSNSPTVVKIGKPITLTADLKGNIVMYASANGGSRPASSFIEFFSGKNSLGKIIVSNTGAAVDHYRYDYKQNCNPIQCVSIQFTYGMASHVVANLSFTPNQSNENDAIYATFNGDRYSQSAAAQPIKLKTFNSNSPGIYNTLLLP